MASLVDVIRKKIAQAKGDNSALVNGLTMTGQPPNQILINPDVILRSESAKIVKKVLQDD